MTIKVRDRTDGTVEMSFLVEDTQLESIQLSPATALALARQLIDSATRAQPHYKTLKRKKFVARGVGETVKR